MILRGSPEDTSRLTVQPAILELLRDLVQDRTGIQFDNERLGALLEKLEPRALARGCRSTLDYYYLLKYEGTPEEWRRIMDSLSVPETYFWRETDQIKALVNVLVPRWFGSTQLPLRIWSAACATGEEPYSIAIALAEAGWGSHPIEILGTDASEAALAKAAKAQFRERSFRSLSPELREKYFARRNDLYELAGHMQPRVKFRWANLLDLPNLDDAAQVEIIFCRNVFIYFSPGAIGQVAEAFSRRLVRGGHLFVGASESLLRLTKKFDLQEIGNAFVYVRNEK